MDLLVLTLLIASIVHVNFVTGEVFSNDSLLLDEEIPEECRPYIPKPK